VLWQVVQVSASWRACSKRAVSRPCLTTVTGAVIAENGWRCCRDLPAGDSGDAIPASRLWVLATVIN
jgi:hypothetical protein